MSITVQTSEPKPVSPPEALAALDEKPEQTVAETEVEAESGSKEQSAPDDSTSRQNEGSDSETETKETVSRTEEEKEEGTPEEKKKKGGFQRRIDKLNAQRTEVERERDYWRRMAFDAGAQAKNQTQPQPPKTQQTPGDATGKPKAAEFDKHEDYVEAVADWKTEQKLRERDQKQAEQWLNQEKAKIANTYQDRMKKFEAKTSDFQEVVSDVNHIQLSPALRDIILNSENGPEIAYELAKVPEEFERITRLPPLAAAREVGKLESRISSRQGNPSLPEKKLTHAPTPLQPVGTGGKGSAPKSLYDPNLSQAEFEAMRAKSRGKKVS